MLIPKLSRLSYQRLYGQAARQPLDASKWDLSVALALVRLPVIAPKLTDIEQKFQKQQEQIEHEGSLLSDFELRMIKDAELLEKRKQLEAEGKDLSELDDQIGKTALQEEGEYKDFAQTTRKTFEIDNREKLEDQDERSLRRRLDERLLLLVKQKFGENEPKKWTLPVLKNNGETLRQTAEKCLGETISSDVNVTIIGNAPFSVHPCKYPTKLAESLNKEGNNIFMYLGYINELDNQIDFSQKIADYRWTSKSELKSLVPTSQYRQKLGLFLYE
ncbi:unnamed protein product [Bursaphelenchus okinawaensis]|uniref:Large ribosomal subunit protein mL46 N-terminal domain-containing protein n=1 Tax=Bursaphelenchus okinawaensis TaxID=465554 RepID=A0A811LKT5_9BILA|nr:unnamed protein product [Bursaphelenchus okinawaensis]CAG9125146.1 unnamed protein product [Bursaphelenchus okinawaensis]